MLFKIQDRDKDLKGIYKITNFINNKVYIGQTIRSFKSRYNSHIQKSKKSNYGIYAAFRKYGIENFNFEILETVANTTKKILNKKKIQYIYEFNSYGKGGYNLDKGGDLKKYFSKKVHLYNKTTFKLERIFESAIELKDYFKIKSKGNVSKFIHGKLNIKILKNYIAIYENDIIKSVKEHIEEKTKKLDLLTHYHKNKSKTVYAYDINSLNLIYEFPSIYKTSKFFNISTFLIRRYISLKSINHKLREKYILCNITENIDKNLLLRKKDTIINRDSSCVFNIKKMQNHVLKP